jgi:hypothetical protein
MTCSGLAVYLPDSLIRAAFQNVSSGIKLVGNFFLTGDLFERKAGQNGHLEIQTNAVLVKRMWVEHVRVKDREDIERKYLDILETFARRIESKLGPKDLGNPQFEMTQTERPAERVSLRSTLSAPRLWERIPKDMPAVEHLWQGYGNTR